jgi:hypothetical protein
MEVCYWALLFMPLVILHHLLDVSVQLANKRGIKKKVACHLSIGYATMYRIPTSKLVKKVKAIPAALRGCL